MAQGRARGRNRRHEAAGGERPPRPPVWPRLRGWLEAGLVLGLLAWLVWRGAAALDYAWQWHRIPAYLWIEHAGEIYPGRLIRGLLVTLQLCAVSLVGMLAFGILAAILRLAPSFTARLVAGTYVELIRNTPLLVQLYLLYFVLAPVLGLDRFVAGVLALSLFEGAYTAEIVRAGILAVPRGQREAALALGLPTLSVWRDVILPQALRTMLPPLAAQVVLLVKHSAIVSVISIFDLTNAGRDIIAETFLSFEVWFTVAAIYLALTMSLSAVAAWLERRFRQDRR